MQELLPPSEEARHHAMLSVLEGLEAEGRPMPSMVLVEDENRSWLRYATRRPIDARHRAVFAATTVGGLVDAIRLEIGGAVWLPASTTSMEAACDAAAAAAHRPTIGLAGDELVELIAQSATELRLVTWRPRSLWRRQLGRRLVERLAGIAERLRCPPVILPWPALLVADRSTAEIESAWRETTGDGGISAPGMPEVAELAAACRAPEPAAHALRALLAGEPKLDGGSPGKVQAQPVHELPGGSQVGWWLVEPTTEPAPGPGWDATPCEVTSLGHVWQLGTGRGDWESIVDTVAAGDERNHLKPVLRVPGWISVGVGRGAPSGLLVERMVLDPVRGDRPVWTPNVDFEGVQFLLSMPGPIWVDGPGVPRSSLR